MTSDQLAVIPSTALPSTSLRIYDRASSDQLTAIDLLMPLPGGYISEPQQLSFGLSAPALQLAATSADDLRPLGEDRGVSETDNLLVDVLEETVSYQLTANSFNRL